ncbi:MAG: cupin domain-containing protein [Candidatus Binatia bacterium]
MKLPFLLSALAAAAAIAGGKPAVRHYDAKTVEVGFARGAVLFDGAGTNYMVHASRREAPGEAEVHVKDTDVIHILQGSATFVTGGEVVEGRTVAPDEIRGREIRDGDVRKLAAGDVVIVPSGTPHWFKAVRGPVTYFVVKVR